MSETTTSTYEQERRQKRDRLRDELKLDPYGQSTQGITPLADIRAQHKPEMGHDGGPVVKGAGRIMLKRDMGKLSFLTIRDETGDLQVALDKKRLNETAWKINELLDLGDQIVVEGPLGITKKGEITVWASGLSIAAKALLPPPAKWEGLSDIEARYRQRYVDLWANPEVMRTMKLRIRIVDEVRQYMKSRGYLEVETPMMQVLHGGAAARPFVTHHNALDMKLFMRIAPELYLKRLLVGGFTKVFELNRNFRNEGISPRHNPEFTMLEAYEAFGSWETMADLVEGMICHLAEQLFGGLKIEHKNAAGEVTKTIDLTRPWRRVQMVDLVEERGREVGLQGFTFEKKKFLANSPGFLAALASREISWTLHHPKDGAQEGDFRSQTRREIDEKRAGQIVESILRRDMPPADIDEAFHYSFYERELPRLLKRVAKLQPAEELTEVYEKLIEPKLLNPTFVTHVPSVIIPLAKKSAADPFFADVYELAINGQEISPGYTELNDPDVQAANFATQVGDKEEQQKVDDDFLNALRYGMPPAGGMGMGIDRLVMMLTGAESIRDVVLFPLMRPT